MGILDGRRILVTGVTNDHSIGFHVARLAQAEGATVVVSNIGKALRITQRFAGRLDPVPPVIELDVTDPDQLARLPEALKEHVDGLDGIVHSIAFANPETALGGGFLSTPWADVARALEVSTFSLKELVVACQPMLARGSSVVGLTFDASISWPQYDWMGVAKAGLESTSRYLARYLGPQGIRCNLVAAGPLDTIAKTAIPGAEQFNDVWAARAPLGWNPTDAEPTAKAVCALLSDYFPATTGEIVHVDGGLHSTGA